MYNWAGKGSKLFLCDADADASEVIDNLKPIFELYTKIGRPIYIRLKEKLFEMANLWNIDEPGFQTLDEWIGMGETVTQQEKTEWGGKGFYGVIFSK